MEKRASIRFAVHHAPHPFSQGLLIDHRFSPAGSVSAATPRARAAWFVRVMSRPVSDVNKAPMTSCGNAA
jgi:hypothetical protein